ncbi:MAG: hypothetical protein JST76_14450 [Bacteroidetes bacterium]|nr:hypothetical protein [Bacteroidota bacterium]
MYNQDFKGTATAQISNSIAELFGMNNLQSISKSLQLEERYTLIALVIRGVQKQRLSLLCIDKEKSIEGKPHKVLIHGILDNQENVFDLFETIEIKLYDRNDSEHSGEYDEEISWT